MADVLYHAMVLLALKGVKVEEVLQVLRLRFSQSGVEEKKSRKAQAGPGDLIATGPGDLIKAGVSVKDSIGAIVSPSIVVSSSFLHNHRLAIAETSSSRSRILEFNPSAPNRLDLRPPLSPAYWSPPCAFVDFHVGWAEQDFNMSSMSYTTERAPSAQSEEVTLNQTVGELQNIQSAYRLNGKNYMKWSQLVLTFLKGQRKLSHLLGTGPKKGDPRFDAWDEEDSMVMSWLWNSMLPEISDTFMFLPTSKEIWEAAQQTYSKVRDAA
ncbi:hypothetical protein RJ639_031625 [Escallonia herrerae]|uniref:Phosphoribosyl-ATP diphosphatase n=1 Tax=Escallonia herrerae TaxID=1293975 RepID=A0AA89BNJ1_9ASTE|nr:hypothetical protein RJ639_031625 [Escallonia herrerae]